MTAVAGKLTAVVRLDFFDAAEVAVSLRQIKEPGAPVGILPCFGIDPGEMQDIAPAEIEGIDPGQDVAAPRTFPAS